MPEAKRAALHTYLSECGGAPAARGLNHIRVSSMLRPRMVALEMARIFDNITSAYSYDPMDATR